MIEFKIVPIRNGSVLDHIQAGTSVQILSALGLPAPGSSKVVSVSMNLPSGRGGLKDVLKFEDMDLSDEELQTIQSLSKTGTYVVIRNYEVHSKSSW